jgi:hypothetical protein
MPHHLACQLEFLRRKRAAALEDLAALERAADKFLRLDLDVRDRALACNDRQRYGAVAELAHVDRLIVEIEKAA